MSVTIAPIRLIGLLLTLAILWPIGILGTIGRNKKEREVPLKSGFRRWYDINIQFIKYLNIENIKKLNNLKKS